LRKFFDPRFGRVQDHVSAEAHATREHVAALTADQHHVQLREQARQLEDLGRFVVAGRDANVDAATFVGEALRALEDRIEDVRESAVAANLEGRIAELRDSIVASNLEGSLVASNLESRIAELQASIPAAIEGSPHGDAISDLDAASAQFLNHAASHTGFAAQRGLWFNWPLSLAHGPQNVHLASVNERIVEVPYVFRALSRLGEGAKILDVGAAESTLALSLASLGFEVVALDPRGYPLEHPNLRAEAHPIDVWDTDEVFDAVLCVSTIEHLGAGEYGEAPEAEGADERALSRMHELTKPGGILVLTTPLGPEGYERSRLETLLKAWDVEDFTVVEQTTPTVWLGPTAESEQPGVALVTATRPD
jgi:SAM-dependent methyltransferase